MKQYGTFKSKGNELRFSVKASPVEGWPATVYVKWTRINGRLAEDANALITDGKLSFQTASFAKDAHYTLDDLAKAMEL